MERLLIVGNPLPFHIGAYLERAARDMGLEVALCDTRKAFEAPLWIRRLFWHLGGKRPPRMGNFGQTVVHQCESFRPTWLLVTGIAPLTAGTLRAIGQMGIRRLNFLTDDPWNPAHRARWFLDALTEYDLLFSPRRAAMEDLQRASKAAIHYLPFGYAPHVHFKPVTQGDSHPLDIVFVGGGDHDRVTLFTKAIQLGLQPTLYGGYWSRYAPLRPYERGHITQDEARTLTTHAVNLCLVRRANRDGHVMRSFEIPACGGCMLAEDTEEHRAIFGSEGTAVLYFNSVAQMVDKAQELVQNEPLRQRLAHAAHDLIWNGKHAYRDRLLTMMEQSDGT
jgi:spore maturation protein CgeB